MVENQDEAVEKSAKRSELVSKMNGKERYQYYKKEAAGRKQQLRLLNILRADVNKKLLNPGEEGLTELKEVELLQQLRDISNQIVALKRNKNNSYFFQWNPSVGLNRKERRNG